MPSCGMFPRKPAVPDVVRRRVKDFKILATTVVPKVYHCWPMVFPGPHIGPISELSGRALLSHALWMAWKGREYDVIQDKCGNHARITCMATIHVWRRNNLDRRVRGIAPVLHHPDLPNLFQMQVMPNTISSRPIYQAQNLV